MMYIFPCLVANFKMVFQGVIDAYYSVRDNGGLYHVLFVFTKLLIFDK